MIVSLYSLTNERKNTPAFYIDLNSETNGFYVSDCKSQIESSREIDLQKLEKLINDSNVA